MNSTNTDIKYTIPKVLKTLQIPSKRLKLVLDLAIKAELTDDFSDFFLFFNHALTFDEADELASGYHPSGYRPSGSHPAGSIVRIAALFSAAANLCAGETGSTYNKIEQIKKHLNSASQKKISVSDDLIQQAIDWAIDHGHLYKKLIPSEYGKDYSYYCTSLHRDMEYDIAKIVKSRLQPNCLKSYPEATITSALSKWTKFQLAPSQEKAVIQAISNQISIITGPPGSGKTSVLDALCSTLQELSPKVDMLPSVSIKLCAPTGKAAIRMSQATGLEATTIHRLLTMDDNGEMVSENLHSCDYLIVDEATMMPLKLVHLLLTKVHVYKNIILIGDVNQLPPIGVGQVFADLIESGVVPTTFLDTQFRQSGDSIIPDIAQKILSGSGRSPFPENYSPLSPATLISYDFSNNKSLKTLDAVEAETVSAVHTLLINNISPDDIQVLSPTKDTKNRLNFLLRPYLNKTPEAGDDSDEFWLDDRVINTKNNYAAGVMNGEIGIVTRITDDNEVIARFPNGQIIKDDIGFSNLELAYAITVHKSQGSEYPIVILPLAMDMDPAEVNVSHHHRHSHQHRKRATHKLLNRSILYTAITRAKKSIIAIGTPGTVGYAMHPATKRITDLSRLVSSEASASPEIEVLASILPEPEDLEIEQLSMF